MEPGSERVCYVHCNFCNTILAVSVPCPSVLNIVTVRCGHCTNLLSVNMEALLQSSPIQNTPQKYHHTGSGPSLFTSATTVNSSGGSSSSSSPLPKTKRLFGSCDYSSESHQPPMLLPPVRPIEKRQRVPSAYNRFIKEEIQRIKASNPDISHREAFSAAAKNWAHFPHIHLGLKKAKVAD